MKYFVVGININNGVIRQVNLVNIAGIRITKHLTDLLADKNIEIANVKLEKGKVVFTPRDYRKYFYKDDGQPHNDNAIVIIGKGEFKGETYYAYSNNTGRLSYVFRNEIDSIGNKQIVNGKVVKEGMEIDIVPLYDEFEELEDKPIFKYDTEYKELTAYMTSLTDRLVIPRVIDNNIVDEISGLVVHSINRYYIEYLELPDTVKKFNGGITRDINHIKVLNVTSDIKEVGYEIETLTRDSIKEVHFKSLKYQGGLFYRCKELEKITFDEQPLFYTGDEFACCHKLNTENLFREGLIGIASSFRAIRTIKNVILPKSLRWMEHTSFSDCENLESIRIQGNTLIASTRDEVGWSTHPDRKFMLNQLNDKNLKIYCPYDYPFHELERRIDNGMVIREAPLNGESIANEKLAKEQLLGMDIKPFDLARGRQQIIDTLKVMNKDTFKEQLIDILKCHAQSLCSNAMKKYIIGKDGLFINIKLPSEVKIGPEDKKVFVTENHVVLVGRSFYFVFTTNMNTLLVYLESKKGEQEQRHDLDFIELPWIKIKASYNKLINISEENGEVVIQNNSTGKDASELGIITANDKNLSVEW